MARALSYDGSTRRRVLTWKRRGWSAQRIATKLGISKQATYHHIHSLIEDGELPPEAVEARTPRKTA